jgi:aminopeptidase N
VGDFAEHWTKQMGYPVVEVRRVDEHRVQLTQKRFKLDESALEKPKFRNAKYWYKWDVPIWYSVNGSDREMVWLHEAKELEVEEGQVGFLDLNFQEFLKTRNPPPRSPHQLRSWR